ncbi:ribonuclease H-like domain-containing protein [Tanacetum coccineum]
MAIGDPSGFAVDLINNLDAGNPLYLQNNDNYILAIVDVKLVGAKIYKIWASAMKIALKGTNKIGFIDGTYVKAETIYSEIASEVWTELKETYDKMDGSVVFNLMHKINSLKQGDLFVPDYYHKLNSLWREFDILTILLACVCEGRIACTCDAKSGSAKHTQLIRLMQFLMGLNDVYQPIRSTILAKDPLPNVKDAFYVSREESQRGLHSGGSSTNKPQPVAFVAKTSNNYNIFNRRVNTNNNNNTNRGPNPNMLCKNYCLIGHTVERYYELIGYPARFKRNPNLSRQSRNNNKRFNANCEVDQSVPSTFGSLSSSFANEQMVKLLSLINENLPLLLICHSKSDMYNVTLEWIIDSGANQQMTDSTRNMFNVVDIFSLMLTVGHPNGTLAKISTIGSLRLSSGIVLFDVLVIPEYNVSLLFVNKMIKDSKLFFGFDENKCYIQDLNQGKIVGTGSEFGGLYLFDLNEIGKCVNAKCNSLFVCHVSSELWHCRLGHPADQVLSILGNKLGFSKRDNLSLCDICHKAKQTRESFPLSDHKTNPIRPYDEKGDTYNVDGNIGVTSEGCNITVEDEVAGVATQIDDNVTSEGNVQTNQNRKIEAMNLEMEALFRNNTYVLADLPPGRKAIGFYVDDIVVTSNNENEIDKFKKFLSSKFMIKDLGLLKYFLGIEVLENENGLCLSQRKYCLELLSEYGLLACKPAATPL